MSKKEGILSTIGSIADIWTIISAIIGFGAGGASVVTYLNALPSYYPITFGLIFIVIILFSAIRSIIKYEKWKINLNLRNKILDEKRNDLLTIGEILWNLSLEYLVLTKKLIEQGISSELQESIENDLKQKMKLSKHVLPSTVREAMDITFNVMKKLKITLKNPERIINTGLITGWILDNHNVGLGKSKLIGQVKINGLNSSLNMKLLKVSSEELKNAIISFQNLVRGADSAYLCERYFTNVNKLRPELKEYHTDLPEWEHEREVYLLDYLTKIRSLAEEELSGNTEFKGKL